MVEVSNNVNRTNPEPVGQCSVCRYMMEGTDPKIREQNSRNTVQEQGHVTRMTKDDVTLRERRGIVDIVAVQVEETSRSARGRAEKQQETWQEQGDHDTLS